MSYRGIERAENHVNVALAVMQMTQNHATKWTIHNNLRQAVNIYGRIMNCNSTKYVSNAVKESKGRGTTCDHAIPLSLLYSEIEENNISDLDTIMTLLSKYCTIVEITNEENCLLTKAGLAKNMPERWDGKDKFARYRYVGIDLVEVG